MTTPIGLALLFLMAVAPALPWRATSGEVLRQRLLVPAWIGGLTMLGAVLLGARGVCGGARLRPRRVRGRGDRPPVLRSACAADGARSASRGRVALGRAHSLATRACTAASSCTSAS